MTRRKFLGATALTGVAGLFAATRFATAAAETDSTQKFEVTKTDAEWKAQLNPQAYRVLRHEDTERPFSSPLNEEHRAGIFHCGGCDLALFSSATKFESGTGWPSFTKPLPGAVGEKTDSTFFIKRTEVHCHRCGGHLGHVFKDGPPPTGLRYCMNGVAMTFAPGEA
jgi:peptide-methionine (R)-S-oxide reductase